MVDIGLQLCRTWNEGPQDLIIWKFQTLYTSNNHKTETTTKKLFENLHKSRMTGEKHSWKYVVKLSRSLWAILLFMQTLFSECKIKGQTTTLKDTLNVNVPRMRPEDENVADLAQ